MAVLSGERKTLSISSMIEYFPVLNAGEKKFVASLGYMEQIDNYIAFTVLQTVLDRVPKRWKEVDKVRFYSISPASKSFASTYLWYSLVWAVPR